MSGGMMRFRKARSGPVLSRDAGERQGKAVRSAAAALGGTEAVRAFLNSHHVGLRARPIDLAVASAAGLAAVEAALGAEARRARPSSPSTSSTHVEITP